MKKNIFKNGFSLIEMLVYISIMIIILLAVTIFIDFTIKSRINSRNLTEIEDQGRQAMQIIGQNIRQADSVSAPAIGASANSTTLNMTTTTINPTIFTLTSGKIQIKQGSGSYTDITNSKVNISTLNFTNVSNAATPGAIKVQITITAGGFTKNYYATYSLR